MRVLISALCCFASAASAHIPENNRFYLSGSQWDYRATGDLQTGNSRQSIDSDLDMRTQNRNYFSLGYIPVQFGWVPEISAHYQQIELSGRQNVTSLTVFGPVTIPANGSIRSQVDIDSIDAAARWPLRLGELFTLSAGLAVNSVDGDVVVTDETMTTESRQNISEVFPLLSLGLRLEPFAALRLEMVGNYISYQGSKAHKLEATAIWQIYGGVALEGGYRQQRYLIETDNNTTDAYLSGGFLGLRYEFGN